ncbi:hypothetical protein KKC60_03340 [Patescibacteria group bacterium]|nr:hypothetical protein [Patescibacteria group bacterium]
MATKKNEISAKLFEFPVLVELTEKLQAIFKKITEVTRWRPIAVVQQTLAEQGVEKEVALYFLHETGQFSPRFYESDLDAKSLLPGMENLVAWIQRSAASLPGKRGEDYREANELLHTKPEKALRMLFQLMVGVSTYGVYYLEEPTREIQDATEFLHLSTEWLPFVVVPTDTSTTRVAQMSAQLEPTDTVDVIFMRQEEGAGLSSFQSFFANTEWGVVQSFFAALCQKLSQRESFTEQDPKRSTAVQLARKVAFQNPNMGVIILATVVGLTLADFNRQGSIRYRNYRELPTGDLKRIFMMVKLWETNPQEIITKIEEADAGVILLTNKKDGGAKQ